MKILVLSTYEYSGGAAVAAARTVEALRQAGHRVDYVVQEAAGRVPGTHRGAWKGGNSLNSIRIVLDGLPPFILRRGRGPIFSMAIVPNRSLKELVSQLAPDVINVHWIGGGFVTLPLLGSLRRPIVWTMHDSWAFTGGCHVPGYCKRFRETCGACPALNSKWEWDLSRWNWYRKRSAYRHFPQVVVTPSEWLAEEVRRSSLLSSQPVHVIPNPLDIRRFSSVDKEMSRRLLGLPLQKKLLLFSAMGAVTDQNKGFDLLKAALDTLPEWVRNETVLVIAGASESPGLDTVASHCLGTLHDEVAMRLLYSAVDMLVVPSRSESFSLVAQEAMSCGNPVVAFAVGGLKELIMPGNNGLLAEPENAEALGQSLLTLLSDDELRERLGRQARMTCVERFDYIKCAGRYDDVFHEAMAAYHGF